MQKGLKSLENAVSPTLFSHSNFVSDFIQSFWQLISPILLCTWKEEGKAAALDRAAQFTGFLQEGVPWQWAELADGEPVLSQHHQVYWSPDSSHGWRAEAVPLKSSRKWRRWLRLSNLAILLQFAFSKVWNENRLFSACLCSVRKDQYVMDAKFPLFAQVVQYFKKHCKQSCYLENCV